MKKISLVTSQGKKMMCCAELIVLSESQYEKLTDDGFAKQIDGIAKELKVDWAIDVVATEKKKILNITRTTPNVIDDEFYHNLEIAADNFMSAIDKLEYKEEEQCPSHENTDLAEEKRKTIDFLKELLHDINLPKEDEEHVLGAEIICVGPKSIPFPVRWGRMSHSVLKEMCELYLRTYDK